MVVASQTNHANPTCKEDMSPQLYCFAHYFLQVHWLYFFAFFLARNFFLILCFLGSITSRSSGNEPALGEERIPDSRARRKSSLLFPGTFFFQPPAHQHVSTGSPSLRALTLTIPKEEYSEFIYSLWRLNKGFEMKGVVFLIDDFHNGRW